MVLRTTVTYWKKNVPKHSTVHRIHQGLHLVIVPLYKDMKKVSKRKIIFISTRVVMSCIQDMIIIFKNISLFEHYYGLSKKWNVSIPVRFTGADLLCPSVLFASHQYRPWSWGCTDSKFNIEYLSDPITEELERLLPSLNQVMEGRGTPDALQLSLALLDFRKSTSRGWWWVNSGGDGSMIKQEKQNQKFKIKENKSNYTLSFKNDMIGNCYQRFSIYPSIQTDPSSWFSSENYTI